MTRLVRGSLVAAVLSLLTAGAGDPVAIAADVEYLARPSRLDPRLRSFLRQYEEARASRLAPSSIRTAGAARYGTGTLNVAADGRLTVDCLIKIEDEAALAELSKLGITPRTRAGNIITVDVPADDLVFLEEMTGVRHVEISRPLKPYLDVSRPLTQATLVHGATMPPYPVNSYTGRNVVVGVIDTGIDLVHGDFRDGNNLTRIDAVWDQTNPVGPAPAGFGYGREWTDMQINGGMATETDSDGHGTHVMGIAAGDGSDTGNGQPQFQFVGIAPESDIIGVKTNFTTGGVADGVAYIFNKAGVRDAVVNLSLGTQDGPHDGTSLFDQGLSSLVGPGRTIVAAAGNEGGAGAHARKMLMAVGDSAIFTFVVPNYTPNAGGSTLSPNDFVVIDGWYEGDDYFSFRVESPNGRRTTEVNIGTNNNGGRCLPTTGGDGRVYVENAQTEPDNNDREIYIELTEGTISGTVCSTPEPGVWKIIAYKKPNSTGPGKIDFWIANYLLGSGGAFPEFADGNSNDYLVGSPASAVGVISVGAFISKRQWTSQAGGRQYTGLTDDDLGTIAPFSSPGPLRNEVLAPVISAPGMGIASAKSGSASIESIWIMQDGKHTINQGTSQASPHVAGTVALIYERYPHEDVEKVMRRLTHTATRDADTTPNANPVYGYGKLNTFTAMALDTPVFLSRFEALPAEGGVSLRWTVENDAPFVGFHVERADDEAGPYARLTADPLGGGPSFEWTDTSTEPGRDYWYRIESIEVDGSLTRFGPLAVRAGAPRLSLAQNGPNPFHATTRIEFTLPAAMPVSVRVYDLAGRLVRTLVDGVQPAGAGSVTWDGLDGTGADAPNGVYFYQIESAAGSLSKKMLLTR